MAPVHYWGTHSVLALKLVDAVREEEKKVEGVCV